MCSAILLKLAAGSDRRRQADLFETMAADLGGAFSKRRWSHRNVQIGDILDRYFPPFDGVSLRIAVLRSCHSTSPLECLGLGFPAVSAEASSACTELGESERRLTLHHFVASKNSEYGSPFSSAAFAL